MTPGPDGFATLFARAKGGCREATGTLFVRYAPHVRTVVRRRMAARLRDRTDSVDVAQDVWLSFLRHTVERLDFPTEGAFLAYLTRMALNKLGEEGRRRAALKNDQDRERSVDADTLPGRGPSPSESAADRERWDRLVGGLTPTYQEALRLLRLGCTHQEVGLRLKVHPKLVQRLLRRLEPRIDP